MHGSNQKPYAIFHRWLRGLLLLCALIAAALIGGWLFVKEQIHDEIRRDIERRFAQANPSIQVRLRSARLVEGRGIEMHGISISRRSDGGLLAYVDEVFAAGDIDLQRLLVEQTAKTDRIRVRGLHLWAERHKDGSWNVAELWPLPKFGKTLPPLTLDGSTIEFVDKRCELAHKCSFRQISLDVKPRTRERSRAAAHGQPILEIKGSLTGADFEQTKFTGTVDPNTGSWSVDGQAINVRLSQHLLDALPSECRDTSELMPGLSGRIDADFHLERDGDSPVRFIVDGQLTNGQIADSRLPHRLFDLEAGFHCDNHEIRIENLAARNGRTTVALNLIRQGFGQNSPLTLDLRVREIMLDERFVEVLPDGLQTVWRKFFPAGRINANVMLEFDGQRWHPEFYVECLETSFVFYKFPYRMEQTRGTVRMIENVLSLDLKSVASGQAVQFSGKIMNPGPDFTGYVDVRSEGPIPLNKKLLDAMIDPATQKVVKSLSPSGMVTISGRFERQRPDALKMSKQVVFELSNCTIQYEKFPYPIGLIQGSVVWNDQGLTFHDLSGRNDSGYIECDGFWRPIAEGGSLLELNLVGTEIPLENELRDALNPSARRLWNDLRMRGSLDHLKVELQYTSAQSALSLDVRAQQWKPKQAEHRGGITMYPAWFPYRFDDVAGVVHYRNGEVTLENVSAVHNETNFNLRGGCTLGDDGRWSVSLRDLAVDHVNLDRDLLTALPRRLSDGIARLNMNGAVNMQGAVTIAGSVQAVPTAPTANWDLLFDIENGDIHCGMDLDHIYGEVRLFGSSNADGFYSRGELNVDSLTSKKIQFTQIQGPFLVDATGVVFGHEAERDRRDRPPRSVRSRVFGGLLFADAGIQFAGDSPFIVNARLQRADMATFSAEAAPQSRNISGKLDAKLSLRGTSQGVHSWRGGGNVRLYEANIYEVPVMLAMLKILSVRQPDTTAFTSSTIDYRVQGQHVYLDRINFDGDAISLKGAGEMTLDRDVNLQFYSLVGRDELSIPVVRRLLSKASQQLLLINVTGTLDQPQVTKEPLPLLKETLDQIFPERARLVPANAATFATP